MSGGVRVLVEDAQGRFLILRRADDGKWGLPAGGMELGESLLDAAARELREETGLRLIAPTPFGLASDPTIETHTYPNGDTVQYITLLVHSALGDQTPVARDGEARAFDWITPDAVPGLDFATPERPTFDHWQRFRVTGTFQMG
ncbi:NUDIX domain-containing protein [Sulfitobacter albidus]|uniref:NUDIX domain-containing protein n=2 Tax=Sulfitobacter albidus TaxID=2829501 RepID=A0A975PNK5_9RHOB|nr:NUDIX domain-containing protein [Sulfitobacter albidus]